MNRDDWVEMDDVAKMTGLTEKTVRQYRGSGRLPKHDAMVGRTPVWEWATIHEWNETRNRRNQ